MDFAVRPAIPADGIEVAMLLREMIPDCDVDARIRWLYETNPNGKALTWLAVADSGEIAGCTSMFPFALWLDGTIVRAALGGDGFVRPTFRRRGVGKLLHETSCRDMPAHQLGCMYGAPGAPNVTPLKQGGSRDVGQVARWTRPLTLGVRVPPFDRLVRSALRPRHAGELVPMVRHDVRVDTVWEAARTALRLASVRDAAFYTWRFLETPSQREPAFVIMSNGAPIGACAIELTDGGKNLRIVDLITLPAAWRRSLRAIARHAIDHTTASTVDIKLTVVDGRSRAMWRAGFVEREAKPFLVMIPAGGDRRFLDPDRWFYGGADSDLDLLA